MTAIVFPESDYSRVPYGLYHDRDIYDREMERIFRGPTWLFLGLEAEIPKAGDFRTSYLGDTSVIYNRGNDGKVYAFVNRCAHRGALVRRELYGNVPDHTCIYHRWNYDLQGNLQGIPFQRGVNGKGGLSPDFNKADHNLQKLRVESYHGLLFASFQGDKVEPLDDYLGEPMTRFLGPRFERPMRILGYQRQHIHGNWKLYVENLRDMYHGSLLHEFQATFGISRVTYQGGTRMDPRHRHNISWGIQGTDEAAETHKLYAANQLPSDRLKLLEPGLIEYRQEFSDNISIGICSIFPNACFQQIRNSLATRQVRPKSPHSFELFWTLFGYEDDTQDLIDHRIRQSNLIGPAGFISMEDGEAVEIAHRAVKRDQKAASIVEMGGKGEISDRDNRVNDVPIRGFWSYYAELMDMEPAGARR